MSPATRRHLAALAAGILGILLPACGKSGSGKGEGDDAVPAEKQPAPVDPKEQRRRDIEALAAALETGDESKKCDAVEKMASKLPESLPQLKVALARREVSVSLAAAKALARNPGSRDEAVARLRSLIPEAGTRLADVLAALRDAGTDSRTCAAEIGKALDGVADPAPALKAQFDWSAPALAETALTGSSTAAPKALALLMTGGDKVPAAAVARLAAALDSTDEGAARAEALLKKLFETADQTTQQRLLEVAGDIVKIKHDSHAGRRAVDILLAGLPKNLGFVPVAMTLVETPDLKAGDLIASGLAPMGAAATEAVPGFRKLLLSNDDRLIRRALAFFSSTTSENCAAAMTELGGRLAALPLPDAPGSDWAVLGRIFRNGGTPAAKTIAARLALESRIEVRIAFLQWLVEIPGDDPEVPRLVVPHLKDPKTRALSREILTAYGPVAASSVPGILDFLESSPTSARSVFKVLASTGMGDAKDADRVGKWVKLNPSVATYAMESLLACPEVGVAAALEGLKMPALNDKQRATFCLGETGGREAIEALKALALDPKNPIAGLGMRALVRASYRDPSAIGALELALKSSHEWIVREALRGLTRAGPAAKAAIPAIRAAAKSKSPHVRARGQAALVAIGEDPEAAKLLAAEWRTPDAYYVTIPGIWDLPGPNEVIAAELLAVVTGKAGDKVSALWLLPRLAKDKEKLFKDLAAVWNDRSLKPTMASGFLLAGYKPEEMIQVIGLPEARKVPRNDTDDLQRELDMLDALAPILTKSPRAVQYVKVFLTDPSDEMRLHAMALLQRARVR